MRTKYYLWERVFFGGSIIIIVLSLYVEWCHPDWTTRLPIHSGIPVAVALTVLGVLFTEWFQRYKNNTALKPLVSLIAGDYERVDIGQDNTPAQELAYMREYNIGLPIRLEHNGDTTFRFTAEYWKEKGGQVQGSIEFAGVRHSAGTGAYRYIKGDGLVGHTGRLSISRHEDEPGRMIVQYQHVFPRDQNPDANRGWEVWEKRTQARVK